MKKLSTRFFVPVIIILSVFSLISCRTRVNAVYFSDLDSSKVKQLVAAEFKEPLIQQDDVLSINVQTIDQSSSVALDQPITAAYGASGVTTPITGFLVDKSGNVEMPMLGVVKLAGLTTTEARELIRKKAATYYKEPTVQVRFANYKITILGEVAKPGSYTVPIERVSVLDAISMAGDLTIFGKRENVMLIRDNGSKKDVVRLNLNSSSLITSSYFYLKQNDILYVEPTKAKVTNANSPRTQLITIGVSIATLLVTILTRL
ncbi:MAG TPA: polysaccharide biosynthesis/export family protein [Pedobacter sp.]|uniref:polysaccharide biosynthesis/export family protein n=1 Tax=Pedobacter sp. TaxID=1411316 RepID=UPI002D120682|nr:polysaccharide biosynthesis/export family protein [Pedobacter sp.]HMI00880.1 polysaccharide biosynthesis/export family protein [Pedobacter sp.]